MPCFTKVATKLLNIATVEAAAKSLGFTVEKRNANSYTLRGNGEYITIERENADQPFSVRPFFGSDYWDTKLMKPLTVEYSKEVVKKYYAKKGYKVSAGAKDNQLVFTKYQG